MKFKLTALGTDGVFTLENWHTNYLLQAIDEDGNKKGLLIDCGSDIRHSLKDSGFSADDVDAVYISHLHGDHCGGLEWLGFIKHFNQKVSSPDLFISEMLHPQIWDNVLMAGMQSIQGSVACLDDFFHIKPVEQNGFFEWSGVKFQLVQTCHTMNGFCNNYSFGLIFNLNKMKIFITSDSQSPSDNYIMSFYESVDIIFQDCETLRVDEKNVKSGVHAHFDDLNKLSSYVKGMMWLTHYGDNILSYGDVEDSPFNALKNGFAGFVKKGQWFEFSEKDHFDYRSG